MNIEKTISEHAVSDILTPMLESQDRIVTEDVAPLFDQATGLDTPPASGSVTTTIEESRSVISAIIRKAWTAPLTMLGGASVIGYITAAYTYLRNRLQGNETYGIPDRRSEISASSPLAANLALLNDRKISNGGAEDGIADGMSLAHLLCSEYDQVTKLIDDNTPWDVKRSINLSSIFPSLLVVSLNCRKVNLSNSTSEIFVCNTSENIDFPALESIYLDSYVYGQGQKGLFLSASGDVRFQALKSFRGSRYGSFVSGVRKVTADVIESIALDYSPLLINSTITEEFICPTLRTLTGGTWNEQRNLGATSVNNDDKFTRVVVGYGTCFSHANYMSNRPNLIYVEIRQTADASFTLAGWNPTNALDASRTDLIEEGSTAQNNLQQFLQNFRDYIAKRLTDNGSGKTLTLSQAVFSEIWDSQGQPQVKGDGLDDLRADIHRIIRTDKQWAVNKA